MYETEPVGEVLDQRAFYNAVLRVETRLGPERLLDACKAVERAFGRTLEGEDGYVKHGPRPIDVDLLLLGEVEYSSERLTLPHREVMTRRFVLVPLLELAPDLELPGRGRASDALERIDGQDVCRGRPAAGDRAVKLLVVDVGNTQTHLGRLRRRGAGPRLAVRDGARVDLGRARRGAAGAAGAARAGVLGPRRVDRLRHGARRCGPQWTGMAARYLGTRCCWSARA